MCIRDRCRWNFHMLASKFCVVVNKCPMFNREQMSNIQARIRLFKASPQLALLQFSLYVVQSNVRSQACMRACRLANSIVPLCSLKNALDRILVLSRTNNLNYPRCHLEFTIKLVRLAGYQHIPGKWRMPTRRRILWMNDKSIWLRPQRSIWQLVSHLILSTTGSL